MKPLRLEEILGLEEYARVRDAYRRAVIAHKRNRRLAVGDKITLLFEDRETLRFQVQEMLQVERIAEPERVQHELDVYNELMPGPRELSATLFIEISEQERIRPELDLLIGVDEHVSLVIGSGRNALSLRARFDPKQFEDERISAVQYIRFGLDDAATERFADLGVPAAIQIDHPNYRRIAPMPEALRKVLVAGLRADPAPLLERPAGPPAADVLLFEVGRLRVIARHADPADLLVVPSTVSSARQWLAGDAAFGADLEEALRRAARHVAERAGSARIEALLGHDDEPVRWRVRARASR